MCSVCYDADYAAYWPQQAWQHVFLSSSTLATHHMQQSKQDLTVNALFAGLVGRTGQLEAALAASQADVQKICNLLAQNHQNSATKDRVKTATRKHRRLTRQHASLQKALRCSDRQKAALQQKAVQLQQLLNTFMDMSRSMQQANSDMGSEMQLLRAELGKLQDELAALHRRSESTQIKTAAGEAAEVAAGGTSTKQAFEQVRAGQDAGLAVTCNIVSVACLLAYPLLSCSRN